MSESTTLLNKNLNSVSYDSTQLNNGNYFHCHDEPSKDDQAKSAKAIRILWISVVICLFFMTCEVIGGFWAKSLAIVTDAAHLIRNYDGTLVGTAEFKDGENSSDEECRMKEAKLKRKRAMFANCYMCQIDPSSQHLHTLGNESAKYDQIKRVKKRERKMDEFHKIYDLQINFAPESMPEFLVRGENIAFIRAGGSLYTRRCLKTFRRTEYADHHVSQHVRSIDSLSDLVVRCPNWMRGCLFYTKRLTPKSGKIRALRSVVFACAKDRSMVSLVWEKCDGCWVESGIAIDFSVADKTPEYVWEPAQELCNHLSNCTYRDVVEYPEERVPVLATNLQQITKEFMLRLPFVA
ncbi:hypothetical protein RB195_021476 [Necator americanus]|uniref:C2H2-type domain-containing protein n=1 Tax=Necator americanus TaxID=51031 RepID=A0ABR1EBI2_NECAM